MRSPSSATTDGGRRVASVRGEVEAVLADPTGWRELSGASWMVGDAERSSARSTVLTGSQSSRSLTSARTTGLG